MWRILGLYSALLGFSVSTCDSQGDGVNIAIFQLFLCEHHRLSLAVMLISDIVYTYGVVLCRIFSVGTAVQNICFLTVLPYQPVDSHVILCLAIGGMKCFVLIAA